MIMPGLVLQAAKAKRMDSPHSYGEWSSPNLQGIPQDGMQQNVSQVVPRGQHRDSNDPAYDITSRHRAWNRWLPVYLTGHIQHITPGQVNGASQSFRSPGSV